MSRESLFLSLWWSEGRCCVIEAAMQMSECEPAWNENAFCSELCKHKVDTMGYVHKTPAGKSLPYEVSHCGYVCMRQSAMCVCVCAYACRLGREILLCAPREVLIDFHYFNDGGYSTKPGFWKTVCVLYAWRGITNASIIVLYMLLNHSINFPLSRKC